MFLTDIRVDNMKAALEMCRGSGIVNIIGLDTVGGNVCEYICTYQVKSGMGNKCEQVRVNTAWDSIEPVEEYIASEGTL